MSDQMNPNKGNQNPWNRSVLSGGDELPVRKGDANPYAAWKRPVVSTDPSEDAAQLEPSTPAEPSFRQMGSDAPTRIARPVGAQQMVSKRKTVERPLSATPVVGGDKPDFTRGTSVPEMPRSVYAAPQNAAGVADLPQAPMSAAPERPQPVARPRPAAQRPSAMPPVEDAAFARPVAQRPSAMPPAEDAAFARPSAARPAAPGAPVKSRPPQGRPAAPTAAPMGSPVAPRPAAPSATRPAARPAARPAMPTAAPSAAPRPTSPMSAPPAYAEADALSGAPRRRRSSRYVPEGEAPQNAAPVGYAPAAPAAPSFDPFEAGDSEATPARRPAVAGERYTGPRTAMPQGGVQARPRPAQRPQADAPAARRMAQPDMQDPRYAYEDEPSAPAPRQRYPYEDLPADDEEPPRRRGGPLVPIVIVLLVIGVALAAICLPNWADMGGGLGSAMNTVKTGVVGVFESAKNAIFPSQERVMSFTVSPTEASAPAELVFSIQTSTAVNQLRVLDDNGNIVASMSDMDAVGGEVTKNSSFTLWTLRYLCENAYTGLFTVQTLGRDGTWDEGLVSSTAASVAAPVAAAPAAQSFNCDTTSGAVPAEIYFSVVTSADVSAVQVMDDNGAIVTELNYADPDAGVGTVLDGTETRTWSLSALIESPYTGRYLLRTLTDGAFEYESSDYVVAVDFAATPEITATPSLAPTATPEPTPSPEPTAEPTPTPTPAPTLLPALDASADAAADPSAIGLEATLYSELKTVDTYTRTKEISINDPFNYAVWQQSGVLTFRSGPFRQNAAYGVADITQEKLAEAWKVAIEGTIKTSSGAVYGVGWPGQAAIVKWPTEVRRMMNLSDEKKETTALKEVIVAAQNGNIYFLDLNDGTPTRDPIVNKWPSNGSVSVATNASPILAVGQMYGKLSGKNVDNGLHLYNLLNCEQLTMIDGREKPANTAYSGVSGSPIFDKATGTMVVGAQNGLLYTMELNDEFDYLAGKLKIKPTTQRYKIVSDGQKAKNTNIDGSVAMYDNYVYYGDQYGTLQCVDVNTLTPVWAVATGDCIDATPALDMEDDTTVSLYTGNMILNQTKDGACVIRKYDALTGEELWSHTVEGLAYNKKFQVGCVASPVVGQNGISDLVIFTVTNADTGATVIALNKASGSVEWTLDLTTPTTSSPVAVYNEAGDAWIAQAESDGKLHLIAAKSGELLDTLQLTGGVEASPAVYRDTLIISTTDKDGSYIYGVKLQ